MPTALVTWWHRLHHWPRRARWPLKAGFFLTVCAGALYPKPWLVPVWIGRLANLDAIVDPTHPGLSQLASQVLSRVGNAATLPSVAPVVEQVVLERVTYAFDWDTWGVMDYLPTVDEVLQAGREDCDGRAVLAAALLRRLGFRAWLVSDLRHAWVVASDPNATPPVELELMSPGKGEKTLAAGVERTQAKLSWGTLENLARALLFGTLVFPLGRELIILAALCAVTMHPYSPVRRRLAGCALALGGLLLLRAAGPPNGTLPQHPWLVGLALALAAGGWVLLALKSRRQAARAPCERGM